MNKIQRTSRYLRWLFTGLMVITPILYVAFWFFVPDVIKQDDFIMGFNVIPSQLIVVHPLTTMLRLLGLTISIIPMSITLLLYANLVTLFLMYERGYYFNLQNVSVIKRIGVYLLLGEILRPLEEAATTLLLTWQNGPGQRALLISLKGNNIVVIITGIMIILISWIIAEGHRLSEDQRLTI